MWHDLVCLAVHDIDIAVIAHEISVQSQVEESFVGSGLVGNGQSQTRGVNPLHLSLFVNGLDEVVVDTGNQPVVFGECARYLVRGILELHFVIESVNGCRTVELEAPLAKLLVVDRFKGLRFNTDGVAGCPTEQR